MDKKYSQPLRATAYLNIEGADEVLHKLDALHTRLQECKQLIYEIGGIKLELTAVTAGPLEDT